MSTAHEAPPEGPQPEEASLREALDHSSDASVVMAPDTTLLWVSAASRRLLGYEPSEMVGRSMIEFLHPDDLERAAEVVNLANDGLLEGERQATPALYSVRHVDGSWVPLEINSSRVEGTDNLFLLVRQSNDLVLGDRLLETVTAEAPFDEQLAIVLELGRWRHSTEGYAIIHHETGGRRASSAGMTDAVLSGRGDADGPTPWNQAMARGATVVVSDLDDRAEVSAAVAEAARVEGFATVIAVPVPDPASSEGACIVVWSTPDGPDEAGHRYPVENMVRSLSLILQWRFHVQSLERAAHEDELTGLASRGRFFKLASEQAAVRAVTVLYVDLDEFKAVNDRYRHAAGDDVLRVVSSRMADVLGPEILLGRLGGDEFAAICPPGMALDGAQALARAVVTSASEPVDIEGGSVTIGASVGVAEGTSGEAVDEVLDRADSAMLGSKPVRRGAWRTAPRV